jgi:hypothetical protein
MLTTARRGHGGSSGAWSRSFAEKRGGEFAVVTMTMPQARVAALM